MASIAVVAVWPIIAHGPSKITNSDRFWKPFLESQNGLIIGIPSLQPRVAASTPSTSHLAPVPALPWPDTVALLALRGYLDRHNVQARMREADVLKLTDLKGGPAILIGGPDNPWTSNYLAQQRFSMEVDQNTGEARIVDAKHPESHEMTVNEGTPFSAAQIDYSIVSRAVDSTTGNYVMQLAGLGNHGSASAAEFAMIPKYMNALDPSLFTCGANQQFVLRTQIVNGSAGVPQVVATACW